MFEFQESLKRGCDNSDYYQDNMQGATPPRRGRTLLR